ncbi:hypothetical protein EMIT0111MI5_230077 [Burkholderia sp. IT-111MI5]
MRNHTARPGEANFSIFFDSGDLEIFFYLFGALINTYISEAQGQAGALAWHRARTRTPTRAS